MATGRKPVYEGAQKIQLIFNANRNRHSFMYSSSDYGKPQEGNNSRLYILTNILVLS